MGYIGSKPATSFETVRKQVSTSNSGTTITLDYPVTSVADIRLTINAVVQSYDNYSVSGSTLTVGGTLNNDRVEILFVGRTYGSIAPTDASVETSALQDDAVTAAKLSSTAVDNTNTNSTLITAQTEKSSLADADKFLISDSAASGALKYVQKSNLPSGSLTLLSMVDQDLGSSLRLQFTQVFSSDYDYYKVIGSFNLGSASAHSVEFRFLNSSNAEQTSGSYYAVAQGWRYSSSANDRSDWGQWGSTGVDIGRDIYGGSYYRKIVLDMDIHPDAYSSTTHNAFNWNMGYTKYQGGTEAVSRIMGYGQYANTTDLSGGGIQFETQNSFDFVNMGIYGVKTTT